MGMLGIRLEVDTGPGLTKQAFSEEVDINKIVAGFEKSGMVTHISKGEPFYGDVSDLTSYQESLDVVMRAEELFMGMSAQIRERFGNDPAGMVRFLEDPANLDEAVKLGMVVKKEPEAPQKVEVVNLPPEEEASVEPLEARTVPRAPRPRF